MLSTSSNFRRYPQRRSNGDIDLVAASRLPLFHVLTESHGIPWSSGSRDYLRKQASATLHTSGHLQSHTIPELDRSSHTAPPVQFSLATILPCGAPKPLEYQRSSAPLPRRNLAMLPRRGDRRPVLSSRHACFIYGSIFSPPCSPEHSCVGASWAEEKAAAETGHPVRFHIFGLLTDEGSKSSKCCPSPSSHLSVPFADQHRRDMIDWG
jgi:hypothetical protein